MTFQDTTLINIDRCLKYALLLGLLALLLCLLLFKMDSCDMCQLSKDGSSVSPAKFMSYYEKECLIKDIGLGLKINLSSNFPT